MTFSEEVTVRLSPYVEVALVIGVHGVVLLIREPRVVRVPVVDVSHTGVGDVIWVEAPRDPLGGDGDPAAAGLGAGGLIGSAVPLINVVHSAVVLGQSTACSQN